MLMSSVAAGRIERVGRMRDLGSSTATSRSWTAAGSASIPGLVDCHTHACFAGDRVDEFARRAGGASYEELHAAGGGILSTVRATRAAGEPGLRDAVAPAPRLDAPPRDDDLGVQVGLRARPRHRARVSSE